MKKEPETIFCFCPICRERTKKKWGERLYMATGLATLLLLVVAVYLWLHALGG